MATRSSDTITAVVPLPWITRARAYNGSLTGPVRDVMSIRPTPALSTWALTGAAVVSDTSPTASSASNNLARFEVKATARLEL